MGKRGSWFSAVKKAFATEPKEKKDQVLMGWVLITINFCFLLCFVFFRSCTESFLLIFVARKPTNQKKDGLGSQRNWRQWHPRSQLRWMCLFYQLKR